MRPDPDAIEASRPGDREIALLAAEVRRLRAVVVSEPALTDAERDVISRRIDTLLTWQKTAGYHSAVECEADTLRGLLERMK